MSAELLNEFEEDPFEGHEELAEGDELGDDVISAGLGESPSTGVGDSSSVPGSAGSDFVGKRPLPSLPVLCAPPPAIVRCLAEQSWQRSKWTRPRGKRRSAGCTNPLLLPRW